MNRSWTNSTPTSRSNFFGDVTQRPIDHLVNEGYKIEYAANVSRETKEIVEDAATLSGKSKKLKYPDVANLIISFDIETTNLIDLDEGVMYLWSLCIDDRVIVGRTWTEFLRLIDWLVKVSLEKECRHIIFVHNLSFEFQFLRSLLTFSPEEVFIVKSRKILKAIYKGVIEFRCSYFLTNMSLSEFTSKMKVSHVKMSGEEFNYNIERFPDTTLTTEELRYSIHDVLGLNEAIRVLLDSEGDSLLTLPLTSTGYVRRDAKEAMRHTPREYAARQLPDYHLYTMLREGFRGGNTHANRFYVGQILENVYSADRSSSYPDVQCNCFFPVSPFTDIGECENSVFSRLLEHEKAIIFRVAFSGIRLRDYYWGSPYIPLDKVRRPINWINDNGRIMEAEYLEITITDIDFRIIEEEYTWDGMNILDLSWANYGPLPPALINVTIGYYRNKTELKGVEGEEIFYTKQKNKLNSIYGMCAQDPVKDAIIMDRLEYKEKGGDPEELLLSTRYSQFMPYQWGVWVTAHARYRLEEGIRLAGDDFVYADTDSVKSLREIDFTEYNKERIRDSRASGAWAVDPAGHTHYMGVFETEVKADRFITWGCKKYVQEKNGKIAVTVSGVSRRHSADELARAGGLEAFRPGLLFTDAGGTEARYSDHHVERIDYDGHDIELPSNVLLAPSTYRLGITNEYEKLLFSIDNPSAGRYNNIRGNPKRNLKKQEGESNKMRKRNTIAQTWGNVAMEDELNFLFNEKQKSLTDAGEEMTIVSAALVKSYDVDEDTTREILAIKDEDGTIWGSISPTFIDQFVTINTWLEGRKLRAEKIQIIRGTSKKGREFLSCGLISWKALED